MGSATSSSANSVSHSVTIASSHYTAARNELVERVKLRDHVLLIYLSFVGAIMGVSFSKNSWIEASLAIPFLGLACGILVSQHNIVIGALIRFINHDLKPSVEALSIHIPDFVSSPSFRGHSQYSNFLRSVGHAIIVITPQIVALGVNYKHATNSAFPMGPSWWFGALFTLISGMFIQHAHASRARVYSETPWGRTS